MGRPDLYILRHGETEWNRAGRWQGRRDSALTAAGVAHAEAQGRLLARLALDPATVTFVSSPQGRALTTARIVAEVAGWPDPIVTDDRLQEIDVGDWTGRSREAIRAEMDLPDEAGFLAPYAAAPGGESFGALHARVAGFLADLAGPAIVVTHGITSRFLRGAALGLDLNRTEALPGGQGVIHRVADGRHSTLAPEEPPS